MASVTFKGNAVQTNGEVPQVGQPAPEFTLTATVDVVEPMGSEIYLYLNAGESNFVVRVSNQDTASTNQDVQVVFDMSKALFFDPETGMALR